MIRYGITVTTGVLLLAGAAWGQVCYPNGQHYPNGQYYPANTNQYYNYGQNYGPPPGHYYCNQHRQYCSHGYTTPQVYDNSRHNNGRWNNNDRRWSNNQKQRQKQWKKRHKRTHRHDDCDD